MVINIHSISSSVIITAPPSVCCINSFVLRSEKLFRKAIPYTRPRSLCDPVSQHRYSAMRSQKLSAIVDIKYSHKAP